jgi:HD-GYP domain-containing protein (c-di-GMP phosphodiesterase class II)
MTSRLFLGRSLFLLFTISGTASIIGGEMEIFRKTDYAWQIDERMFEMAHFTSHNEKDIERFIGRMVKHDMICKTGLLLVPSRTVITKGHLKLLEQHRVELADYYFEESRSPADMLMEEAVRYTEDLFYRIRVNRKVPLLEIRSQLVPVIEKLVHHQDVFEIIDSIKAKDKYTYRHSVGVSVLSALIGKWLGWESTEISILTLAGLLHDVGMLNISEELLHKPESLTEEEYEEIKRHTVYGYEMLKETPGLNPRVALVALQHHERVQGTGYPLGLKQKQMDPLSRIVAVADTFHAMTSMRPYQSARVFHDAVEEIRNSAYLGLDPEAVHVLLKHLFTHLIGRRVMLSDGRWGEVIFLIPYEPYRALLQVEEEFLDLSMERELQIMEVIS